MDNRNKIIAVLIIGTALSGLAIYKGINHSANTITAEEAESIAKNFPSYSNLESISNSTGEEIEINSYRVNSSSKILQNSPLRNKSGYVVVAQTNKIGKIELRNESGQQRYTTLSKEDNITHIYHLDVSGQIIGDFRGHNTEIASKLRE